MDIKNLETYLKLKKIEGRNYQTQIDAAYQTAINYVDRKRYCVLVSQCQSGKTGVILSLINLMNYPVIRLKAKLGIEYIFYITGDNQKIKDQTIEDFNYYCLETLYKFNVNIRFLKNSDLRKTEFSLKNSLIIIDESHYGTKDKKNMVSKWLKKGGINYMKNDEQMKLNNTYILSVSATPYKELDNDEYNTKALVELCVTDKYKGFIEFDLNNQIKTLEDKSILKDETKCLQFFNNTILPHLKSIKEKKGKKKFVIVRNRGGKGSISIDLKNILSDKFHVVEVFLKGDERTIDHSIMTDAIKRICMREERWKDKYLLIVIKGILTMGQRIENEYKAYCGAVLDYSDDKKNVETTVQGLVGRMSGYVDSFNENEWMDTIFFVSKTHYDILNRFHTQFEFTSPYEVERKIKYFCADGDKVAPNDEILKRNGVQYYNVTSYFDKNQYLRQVLQTNEDETGKYLITTIDKNGNEITRIVREGLENIVNDIIKFYDEIPNKYLTNGEYVDEKGRATINGGNRRIPHKDGKFYKINAVDSGKKNKQLTDINNIGCLVRKATLIMNDEKGQILQIQETIIDRYKYVDEKVNSLKEIETYKTVEPNFDFELPTIKTNIEVVA